MPFGSAAYGVEELKQAEQRVWCGSTPRTSVPKKTDFSVLTKTPAEVLHGAACLVWLRIKRCLAAQIADVIFFLLFGEPMCRFCRVNLIYENGR